MTTLARAAQTIKYSDQRKRDLSDSIMYCGNNPSKATYSDITKTPQLLWYEAHDVISKKMRAVVGTLDNCVVRVARDFTEEKVGFGDKISVRVKRKSYEVKLDIGDIEATETKHIFDQLAATWRQETQFESSYTKLVTHDSYQQIIGLGEKALPLIFEDLKQTKDLWSWALKAITRQNPLPENIAGNTEQMADAWLEWGKKHNYVKA